MAIDYPIPSWISNIPDPVAAYSHGLQIGSQIGTEQARQQMAQENMLRETTKDAVDQEIEKGKFHLASDAAARQYADQVKFTQLVQGGMDPAQAMLQVPGIATQTSAIIRAQQEGQLTDYQKAEIENQKQNIELRKQALTQRLTGKEYGDIQTVDLGDGVRAAFRPGSPGLHILPPPGEKEITPNAAASLLAKIPEIDAMSGTAGTTNALAKTLAPSLLDTLHRSTTKKINPSTLGKPTRFSYDPKTGTKTPLNNPILPPPEPDEMTDLGE